MDAQGATTAAAPAGVCTLDQYDLVGVIGKGSFGTVSRIRRKADGRIMVWKELNYGTMREKEKQLVVSEVRGLLLGGSARREEGRGWAAVPRRSFRWEATPLTPSAPFPPALSAPSPCR